MANEERASDTVVEETELDQAIEDIIDMTEAAEEEHAHKAAAKRASEKERITAEDVRKRSMERLAETQKRQNSEVEVKKKRSNGKTMEFLREKAEKGIAIKREESELKKRAVN